MPRHNRSCERSGSAPEGMRARSSKRDPGPRDAGDCRRSAWRGSLIAVKHLFHAGPPLAFRALVQGLLHGRHNGPPLLCLGISGHSCHVCGIIGSVILEIPEERVVFQEDGVIADVTAPDHGQHFRPHLCVIFLVGLDKFRPYFDHRTVTLHFCSPFGALFTHSDWLGDRSKARSTAHCAPQAALLYSVTLRLGYKVQLLRASECHNFESVPLKPEMYASRWSEAPAAMRCTPAPSMPLLPRCLPATRSCLEPASYLLSERETNWSARLSNYSARNWSAGKSTNSWRSLAWSHNGLRSIRSFAGSGRTKEWSTWR